MQTGSGSTALQVLFIGSSPQDTQLLTEQLVLQGYEIVGQTVSNPEAFRQAIEQARWDVVIANLHAPEFPVSQALNLLARNEREIPLVCITLIEDETAARLAIEAGAQDCLDRAHLGRLSAVVERERRENRLRQERISALDTMRGNDARFHALAANVPGVLFQMEVTTDGLPSFLYVSEGTQMLFGLSTEEFLDHDNPLVDLLLPEDRTDFLHDLRVALSRHTTLNWEGRILPEGADIKWINLRCSPRETGKGQHLWEGVMWNITQSKVAEVELRRSQAQLAELSNHLQSIKEEERERIARDIHDVLGGTLVGMKFSTALLAGKIEAGSPLLERVRQIETMIDDAITTAGRVARELRPGILKEFGLAAAIESHAEDFKQRTGIACEVLCADHDIETTEDAAIALFRTYQEALTNISKHARAQNVEVRVMQEGDEIVLEVSDDGRGIDSTDLHKPKSFGLRSIRERLHSLGGTMAIQPRTPHGTTVVLRAPLVPQRAELSRENIAFPGGQA